MRHPLDVVPPVFVNLEVRMNCQDYICLFSTRRIKVCAAPGRLLRKLSSLLWEGGWNKPEPPSTCYLVCGSKVVAVRHCCSTSCPVDHAISRVHVLYGQHDSLGPNNPLVHHNYVVPHTFYHVNHTTEIPEKFMTQPMIQQNQGG